MVHAPHLRLVYGDDDRSAPDVPRSQGGTDDEALDA
jgi:hypothetical protein